MEIRDIERGMFQMGRLHADEARSQFPLLTERLGRLSYPSPARSAMQVFEMLRELREELTAPELVNEMNRLLQLEPTSA